jgi:hypothetical protein
VLPEPPVAPVLPVVVLPDPVLPVELLPVLPAPDVPLLVPAEPAAPVRLAVVPVQSELPRPLPLAPLPLLVVPTLLPAPPGWLPLVEPVPLPPLDWLPADAPELDGLVLVPVRPPCWPQAAPAKVSATARMVAFTWNAFRADMAVDDSSTIHLGWLTLRIMDHPLWTGTSFRYPTTITHPPLSNLLDAVPDKRNRCACQRVTSAVNRLLQAKSKS